MAPAMNPRTVCFCQPIFSTISARVAPFLRCSMATTWAVLLPLRGAAVSGAGAAFWPLGACLTAVRFLAALRLAGAPLGDPAPTMPLGACLTAVRFLAALRLAGAPLGDPAPTWALRATFGGASP